MKPVFLSAYLLAVVICAQAQTVPYNVVFDLTSQDTNDHKAVIR